LEESRLFFDLCTKADFDYKEGLSSKYVAEKLKDYLEL